MTTRIYAVEGMTCDHCVAAVTIEVAKVPGISDVIVNLEQGTLTVSGDAPEQALAEAVDEAGYALVMRRSGVGRSAATVPRGGSTKTRCR